MTSTVQAVGIVTGLQRDNSNPGNFIAAVQYAVVGQTGFNEHTINVSNLNPSALGSTIQTQLEADLKTYLQGIGVTFGLLDTVRIVPGIV